MHNLKLQAIIRIFSKVYFELIIKILPITDLLANIKMPNLSYFNVYIQTLGYVKLDNAIDLSLDRFINCHRLSRSRIRDEGGGIIHIYNEAIIVAFWTLII